MYNKLKKDANNESMKKKYKEHTKKLDKMIYDAKISHEQKNVQKNINDPKKLWEYINTKISKKSKKNAYIPHLVDEANKKITDNFEIASKFNEFFSEIGNNLSKKITAPSNTRIKMPSFNLNTMYIRHTDVAEVSSIIHNLKNKNGGIDNINAKVLKT